MEASAYKSKVVEGENVDRKNKTDLKNRINKVIFHGCYLANVNCGLGFLWWCYQRNRCWSNHRKHYRTETRHSWDRGTWKHLHSTYCTRRSHNKTRTNHCWIGRRIPEKPCINKRKQFFANSSVDVLHLNIATTLA